MTTKHNTIIYDCEIIKAIPSFPARKLANPQALHPFFPQAKGCRELAKLLQNNWTHHEKTITASFHKSKKRSTRYQKQSIDFDED